MALYELLKKTQTSDSDFYNHVSMINPKGKYQISKDETETFWKSYCTDIYNEEKVEYGLAEKPQLYLPVLVDADIKILYNHVEHENKKKLYTDDQIKNVIKNYQDVIKDIVDDCKPENLICFVLEKDPYIETKGDNTEWYKSGFHLHFPNLFLHKNDHTSQLIPRVKKNLNKDMTFKFLGFENSGDIIDPCYVKNPWLLYGCKKKEGMQSYKLTKIYNDELNIISLEDALKNYDIYNVDERKIEINNYKYHLPRILSIIPSNRECHELKQNLQNPIKLNIEPKEEKEEKEEKKDYKKGNQDLLIKCLEKIKPERFKQYEQWLKLLAMCKGNNLGVSIFNKLSKESGYETYNKNKNIDDYEKCKVNEKIPKFKTILNWAEEDGVCLDDILSKEKIAFTDKGAALIIIDLLKDIYVIDDGLEFFKEEKKWIIGNTKNNQELIDNNLRKIIYDSDIKTIKADESKVPFCENHSRVENIIKALKSNYPRKDDDFLNKMYISNKGKLCFNNGVYNFFTKSFSPWAENKDVYVNTIINYDYKPKNFKFDECKQLLHSIWGKEYDKIMNYQARRLAGHIEDKKWAMIIGERNSGKGLNDTILMNTFQKYIGTINPENFCIYRNSNGQDTEKQLGFLIPVMNCRAILTSELAIDTTLPVASQPKINGTFIKKIHSGGDIQEARLLFSNSIKFRMQGSIQMSMNDKIGNSSKDSEDELVEIHCPHKFVDQCEIDENPSVPFLRLKKPTIKEDINNNDYHIGFLHCFIEAYDLIIINEKPKDNELYTMLSHFEKTDNKKDFLSNTELDLYITGNKLIITRKKLIERLE